MRATSIDSFPDSFPGVHAPSPPPFHSSLSAASENVRGILSDLVRLARPKEWIKNVFVLAPFLFSELLVEAAAISAVLLAAACFCLWSSAIYSLNDILDVEVDRNHPRKKNRPLASGRLPISLAIAWSALLGTGGAVVAWLYLAPGFIWFGALYVANSIVYCAFLKHRVIADVISIAIGFVLRLLAGCWAIGVQPSSWIIVCGFSLALLLGFGKRRLELGRLESPSQFRRSLQSYTVEKLNLLLGVTSAMCLLAYMLYTVSPQTIRVHGSEQLVYTVPFVAYGVFRYLFKVQEGRHDGPAEVLVADPVFALNGMLWIAAVVVILYG